MHKFSHLKPYYWPPFHDGRCTALQVLLPKGDNPRKFLGLLLSLLAERPQAGVFQPRLNDEAMLALVLGVVEVAHRHGGPVDHCSPLAAQPTPTFWVHPERPQTT